MLQTTLLNNRYRIIRELGAGGFGETHLAEDTQMPSGRRCVIKQLKPMSNDPQVYQLVKERFQREAAILEELGAGSNQIPHLYAYFESDGQFYLVQEWIEGFTLAAKVQQEGNLSESSVKEILIGLLPVLDYVHGKRIVHRDIKPDNIILRYADGKPVLIDFGAVRETMATVVTSQGNTAQSIVIGTPGFMPSEQSTGRAVYASDIYSLGLTAIYLLTGKIPQEIETDPSTGEILWRRYALSVTPTFAAILDKAIQLQPRDRFSSAREMLEALYSRTSPTVISSLPGAPPQPPTVISAAPSTPHQTPFVGYPQPGQPPIKSSGLGDWQKAVIIGSVIGACVVAGLVVTRPQSEVTAEKTPETPVAQQSSLSSPSPSPSLSPTAVVPVNPPPNPPIQQPSATPVSIQQPQPIAPSAASISQSEAVNLISKWIQAKRVMFAPPYNYQLANELTTGELYRKTADPGGSIDWLQKNSSYYRYGVQRIDSVERFEPNGNNASLEVVVTEERTLYDRKGNIDRNNTDLDTLQVRYSLQSVNGQWKIADYKTVRQLR
jgi:serine/threonine-protein kinase